MIVSTGWYHFVFRETTEEGTSASIVNARDTVENRPSPVQSPRVPIIPWKSGASAPRTARSMVMLSAAKACEVRGPLHSAPPPQPRAIATNPDATVEERRSSAAYGQKYGHAERSESLRSRRGPLHSAPPPQPRAIATSPDNTVEERRFSAALSDLKEWASAPVAHR